MADQDVQLNIRASVAALESELSAAEDQIDNFLARIKKKPILFSGFSISEAQVKELAREVNAATSQVGKNAKVVVGIEIADGEVKQEAKQQAQKIQGELNSKPAKAKVEVKVDQASLAKAKKEVQQVQQQVVTQKTASPTSKVTSTSQGNNPILNKALKDIATVGAVIDALSSRAAKAGSKVDSQRQQVARIIRNEPRRDGLGEAGVAQAKEYLSGQGVELKQTNTRKLRTEIADLISDSKKISSEIINGLTTHLVRSSAASDGASEVAKGIIQSLKNELKISSPSKVTEGIGRDLVRGLTKGQAEESASAIRQARQVSNFLIAEYQRIKKAQGSIAGGRGGGPPMLPPPPAQGPGNQSRWWESFRTSEGLIQRNNASLDNLVSTFARLDSTVSQSGVNAYLANLRTSIGAVSTAFKRGQVSARDFLDAQNGLSIAQTRLEAQPAYIQNLIKNYKELGLYSEAYVNILRQQEAVMASIAAKSKTVDIGFMPPAVAPLNLSPDQQMRANKAIQAKNFQRANDAVLQAQSNSGFGGFRGREIGNPEIERATKLLNLEESIERMRSERAQIGNRRVNNQFASPQDARVYKSLSVEISSAERAMRVLNGTARAGETTAHLMRNAWGTLSDDFANLVPQLIVFGVAYGVVMQGIARAPGAVLNAAGSFNKLEVSISSYLAATRNIGNASSQIQQLRKIGLDLGIGFEKAAQSYLRMAAATQGTTLEGQEVGITKTLATSGRNLGLSGAEIDRASTALTQIASKGTVQMEELKGQLAEALPGAIQVSARAFNVTTKELYGMIEAGQIASDEFITKFIGQLEAEGGNVNQLGNTFSNVAEQLGASFQALAAAGGEPLLAPLTLGMQALNGIIQAMIPIMPVITAGLVLMGKAMVDAQLKLQGTSIANELKGMTSALAVRAGIMGGLTEEMGRGRKAAELFAASLKAIGKAALIGAAFEGISYAIKLMRGEIGSLNKEVDRAKGLNNKFNPKQNNLGVVQKVGNFFDFNRKGGQFMTMINTMKMNKEVSIGNDKLNNPQNMAKLRQQASSLKNIDQELEREKIKTWQAEQARDSEGTKKSIERAKTLANQRAALLSKMTMTPQEVQQRLYDLKTTINEAQVNRDLYKKVGNTRDAAFQDGIIKNLQTERAELEKLAKTAGLLDKSFRIDSLGGLKSRAKDYTQNLDKLDVNGIDFRRQQRQTVGIEKAVQDMQLMPEEMALRTQELTMQKMTEQLRLQESITQAKLTLIDNEKSKLEAVLGLERSRGSLREAVAQRRVAIAGVTGIPEEQLAAQAILQKTQTANKLSDLTGQQSLLSKDRERAYLETEVEKQKLAIQKQQLDISKQQLEVEKIKIMAAMETQGISTILKNEYKKQLEAIDGTISATNSLVGQQSSLNGLLDQSRDARLQALDLQMQSLEVQKSEVRYTAQTEEQVRQIQAAYNVINRKAQDANDRAAYAANVAQAEQEAVGQQVEHYKSIVNLQKERSQITQDNLNAELQSVDKLLEAYSTRNEGGVFERMAKNSAIGMRTEQEMMTVAQQRMQLQKQLQDEQTKQKKLDLDIKQKELEIEMAIFRMKMAGARIANEQAKIDARARLEKEYANLSTLGSSPEVKNAQAQIASQLGRLGGFNTAGVGSSVNTNIQSALFTGEQALNTDNLINLSEARQGELFQMQFENIERQKASLQTVTELSDQLFQQDAAAWFGSFIDKTTELGQVMSVAASGISNFRADMAQAFTDSIMKGEDFNEAAGNAASTLSNKIMTSIADQMIFKPMEEAFFSQLGELGIFKEQMDPQKMIQQNTSNLLSSTVELNSTVENGFNRLIQEINGSSQRMNVAAGQMSKPSTETPTYPGGSFETSSLVSQGTYQGSVVTAGGGVQAKPRQPWQKYDITPERRAFLNTLRFAEGTWAGGSDKGYQTMYGGGTFNDMSRHPDKVVHTSKNSSAAAGAYQFMPFTWEAVKKELNLPNFGKDAQDQAALRLLEKRGALADVDRGNFTKALSNKISPEWASFPTLSGSSYYSKQSVQKFDDLSNFYKNNLQQIRANPQSAGIVAGTSSMSGINQAIQGSNVNFNDPVLKAIANSSPVQGAVGDCVQNVFNHLTRLSKNYVGKIAKQIENPGAGYSLSDQNDPRAAVVDLVKDHNWTSLPGLGTPRKLSNARGSATVNTMDLATYQNAAKQGLIPSGALMYSTKYSNPNASSPVGGSHGYDLAIVRNKGKEIDNSSSFDGQTPYGSATQHIAILVPKSAVVAGGGSLGGLAGLGLPQGPQFTTTTQTFPGLAVPGLNQFGVPATTPASPTAPVGTTPLSPLAPTPTIGGATPVVVTNMPPPSPTGAAGGFTTGGLSAGMGIPAQGPMPFLSGMDLSTAFTDLNNTINLTETALSTIPNVASQFSTSFPGLDQSAVNAQVALDTMSQGAQQTQFQGLSNAITGIVGVIGQVSMFMSGLSKMKEGGTHNTLLGLGSMFMSAGGLLSGFGGGGGGLGALLGIGGREKGGHVNANTPYIVGESGIEIFRPRTYGSIVSNPETQKIMAASTAKPADSFSQMYSANQKSIEQLALVSKDRRLDNFMTNTSSMQIGYNRVGTGDLPFITEEDAKAMARQAANEGAKMGQQKTLAALRNNPATRRGIGV